MLLYRNAKCSRQDWRQVFTAWRRRKITYYMSRGISRVKSLAVAPTHGAQGGDDNDGGYEKGSPAASGSRSPDWQAATTHWWYGFRANISRSTQVRTSAFTSKHWQSFLFSVRNGCMVKSFRDQWNILVLTVLHLHRPLVLAPPILLPILKTPPVFFYPWYPVSFVRTTAIQSTTFQTSSSSSRIILYWGPC